MTSGRSEEVNSANVCTLTGSVSSLAKGRGRGGRGGGGGRAEGGGRAGGGGGGEEEVESNANGLCYYTVSLLNCNVTNLRYSHDAWLTPTAIFLFSFPRRPCWDCWH